MMFVALRMITLPGGQTPDDRTPNARTDEIAAMTHMLGERAAALLGVQGSWAAPVTPGATINAGDFVWRMTFATEAEALRVSGTAAWAAGIAPLLEGAQVSTVGYRLTAPVVRRTGPGIWRALVFRVMPYKPPELVRRLEEATLLLPRHVPEIRSWALSPISYTEGPKAFTHVWEQEFDTVADLTGPYMTSPAHWGIADAFFDAEYPEYIVDPHLTQTVGAISDSIIAPTMP